jgi:hypothetical protein
MMRSREIDAELEEVNGVAEWSEHVHGTTAQCRLDGRHLRSVLGARPAFVALWGVPPYSLPALRTTCPPVVAEAAPSDVPVIGRIRRHG